MGPRSGILCLAHVRLVRYIERERSMARQFLVALFMTLAFAGVVLGALFGIFTLVSYLAGPVGG